MPSSSPVHVTRVHKSSVNASEDQLAAEEPLEIRIDYTDQEQRKNICLAITMRTPGNDFELATGFLISEGIIAEEQDLIHITTCGEIDQELGIHNTVKAELAPHVQVDIKQSERNFYISSSCGVCGKTAIEHIDITRHAKFKPSEFSVEPEVLKKLPELMKKHQTIFNSTGGLHASALFNPKGELLVLHEDVGRHNALDKLIGAIFKEGYANMPDKVLLVSGRISFELVQKAVMAGISFMAAIGPPSNLALKLAKEFDITLIGFLKKDSFNIYHGKKRIS